MDFLPLRTYFFTLASVLSSNKRSCLFKGVRSLFQQTMSKFSFQFIRFLEIALP
jgi:hypothetical protein